MPTPLIISLYFFLSLFGIYLYAAFYAAFCSFKFSTLFEICINFVQALWTFLLLAPFIFLHVLLFDFSFLYEQTTLMYSFFTDCSFFILNYIHSATIHSLLFLFLYVYYTIISNIFKFPLTDATLTPM